MQLVMMGEVAQVRIRGGCGGGWLLVLVVQMGSICCYHLDLILIRIRLELESLEAVEDVRHWSFDDFVTPAYKIILAPFKKKKKKDHFSTLLSIGRIANAIEDNNSF